MKSHVNWSVEQVGEWLEKINCAHFISIFGKQEINGKALIQMSKLTDLQFLEIVWGKLGVECVGDAFLLLFEVRELTK